MITIADYGAGNICSVEKAFKSLGFKTETVCEPEKIRRASHIVLPGVGAFSAAAENLRKKDMDAAIAEAIADGKNFLGICLGMQLLFENSEEGGGKGLGIFSGKVVKFDKKLIVPHTGWNKICGADDIIFGEKDYEYVYFVHSYYKPLDGVTEKYAAAVCSYGIEFCAAVRKDNCIGVQFHPEKSGDAGIAMLKRFGGLK